MNPSASVAVSLHFGVTIAVAAFLLFVVQPVAARWVLPILGGSPAVWTTCSLLFQTCFLAGYLYAHVLALIPSRGLQVLVHSALLFVCARLLPLQVDTAVLAGEALSAPVIPLLLTLSRALGLPVLTLAATAPLLQAWFGRTRHPHAHEPYALYAASNLGSLLGLLAYPVWLEAHTTLSQQTALWSWSFVGVAWAIAGCGIVPLVWPAAVEERGEAKSDAPRRESRSSWRLFLGWISLALIPSSLMLGVTTHITTDLASVPLFWVVPLGLYLVTYMVAFSPSGASIVAISAWLLPGLGVLVVLTLAVGLVQIFWIPVHLAFLFAAATVAHGELARRRPAIEDLTWFYLAIATGGMLGGVFNALVAPWVFQRVQEYPLAVIGALFVLAVRIRGPITRVEGCRAVLVATIVGGATAVLCANPAGISGGWPGAVLTILASGLTVFAVVRCRVQSFTFAATLGALLAASGLASGVNGQAIWVGRNFFGVTRVTETSDRQFRRLFHGSTLHGQQALDPGRGREPLTYFTESGPIGDVFRLLHQRDRNSGGMARVAVTGLGVGTLAAYAEPGEVWSFHEIDPAMCLLALDPRYFSYLSQSRASSIAVRQGDARLTIAREPPGSLNLLILDAFSSDAIPVHLLTREALSLYRIRLAPGALLVCNITNRYLDLAPVVASLAADAGWVCRVRFDVNVDSSAQAQGKLGSIWAILAADTKALGALADDPRWITPRVKQSVPVWTDEFSSLLPNLRWGRVVPPRSSPGAR